MKFIRFIGLAFLFLSGRRKKRLCLLMGLELTYVLRPTPTFRVYHTEPTLSQSVKG